MEIEVGIEPTFSVLQTVAHSSIDNSTYNCKWCAMRDLNPHAEASGPKPDVSAVSPIAHFNGRSSLSRTRLIAFGERGTADIPNSYGGRYRSRTCRDLLSESSMTASCINRPLNGRHRGTRTPMHKAGGFEPPTSAIPSCGVGAE